MESFEKTTSNISSANGNGPGSTNLIETFSDNPLATTRLLAASQTGLATSIATTLRAPHSLANRIAHAPEPHPISITDLPEIVTPSNTRRTSSAPPGDKNPSPHRSSRKAIIFSS